MPGAHGAGCNCAEEAQTLGLTAKWLNPSIALDQAVALNVETGDIKTVLRKTYAERLQDALGFVATPEDDNEMLIFIPFASPVLLQSVYIIGGEGQRHPRKARLFANPPTAATEFSDFEDRTPEQELDVAADLCGTYEYPLRANKFCNLQMLVVHLVADEGADEKELYWIGLKGIPTQYRREAVITVYESQANAADHKTPEEEAMEMHMMQ
ncbi:unnamed protein product [Amoebophrya sp. A25]|nr:unnamed protein product [Amoebophrya sp. A25]|eukprot:GSA25T00020750001.1